MFAYSNTRSQKDSITQVAAMTELTASRPYQKHYRKRSRVLRGKSVIVHHSRVCQRRNIIGSLLVHFDNRCYTAWIMDGGNRRHGYDLLPC